MKMIDKKRHDITGNGQYRHDELPLEPMDANAALRMFDAQRLEVKQRMWYSSLNLALDGIVTRSGVAEACTELAQLEADYARQLWGSDYPACAVGYLPPRTPGTATLRATRNDPTVRRR